MNTITPAELLSLVIQYAEYSAPDGFEPIGQDMIAEVAELLVQCGKTIADYRATQK